MDYQPRQYRVPHDVYKRVYWVVRGYDRMVREYNDIINSVGASYTEYKNAVGESCRDYAGHSSTPSKPTEQRALKLERLGDEIHAIDAACNYMRSKLRREVCSDFDCRKAFLNYAYYSSRYNFKAPSESSWNRYRTEMVRLIAQKLKII